MCMSCKGGGLVGFVTMVMGSILMGVVIPVSNEGGIGSQASQIIKKRLHHPTRGHILHVLLIFVSLFTDCLTFSDFQFFFLMLCNCKNHSFMKLFLSIRNGI